MEGWDVQFQVDTWIATFSPKWQTDSVQEGLFSETKQPSYEPDDSIEKISWNYFDFLNNILQILLLNSRAISHFHNGHLLRQLNGHPICLWSYWTPSIPLFPFQEKVLSFFGNTIQIRKLDLIHIFKSYCLFFCKKKLSLPLRYKFSKALNTSCQTWVWSFIVI